LSRRHQPGQLGQGIWTLDARRSCGDIDRGNIWLCLRGGLRRLGAGSEAFLQFVEFDGWSSGRWLTHIIPQSLRMIA
jgi:hypothetical protein